MPSTERIYQQPSRRSRALVIVSSTAVALLALWILTPIVVSKYTATSAAVSKDQEPTQAELSAPPVVALAQTPVPPAVEPAPPLPDPISITAAQAPFQASLPVAPVASAPSQPLKLTAAPDEPKVERGDPVPLPPRRPHIASAERTAIPLPRPRPGSEDNSERPSEIPPFSNLP